MFSIALKSKDAAADKCSRAATSFKNICKNSTEHCTRDASVRPKTVIFDTKMVLMRVSPSEKEVWSALRARGTFAVYPVALDRDVRPFQCKKSSRTSYLFFYSYPCGPTPQRVTAFFSLSSFLIRIYSLGLFDISVTQWPPKVHNHDEVSVWMILMGHYDHWAALQHLTYA